MVFEKVFCENCRNDVEYSVIEEQMIGTIKGEIYTYTGKVAKCKECKSDIFVNSINDYNLKALYDVYREENGIISLEKVLGICEKYNISKRPLSLLLGWGEQTYSRYCNGDIPSKQYSDILNKIYESPVFYSELLENNKEKLPSEIAYKKSKEAVDKILEGNLNNESKINRVINYILNRCGDITPLALQKSLYYVQGFYYAFNDKFLFEEDCQAWAHGPVYPEVYFKYKHYKFDPIESKIEVSDTIFTSSELIIMENVVKHFCCYSGKVLEKFTHSEYPWLETRGEIPELESSTEIIKKEYIGKYFKDVKEKYNMINPNDIESYAKKMFDCM